MNNTIILTDGGIGIGNGHITRCSTIHNELKSINSNSFMWVKGEGLPLQDNDIQWQSIDYLEKVDELKGNTLIIDSYRITKETIDKLSMNNKVILIDDFGDLNQRAYFTINPSPFLSIPIKHARYHYGSEFVLLRPPFLKRSEKCKRNHILVTMGGSDNLDLSKQVVEHLKQWDKEIKIHLVVGSAFRNKVNLYSTYNNDSQVIIYDELDATEMRNQMAHAKFCVSACGQTIFELLKTETPFVAIQTIENQSNNAKFLNTLGLVVLDGTTIDYDSFCSAIITNSTVDIPTLVDGEGASRVATLALHGFYQRQMKMEDCRDVFELSNLSYVREFSLNKEPIPWEEHCKWYVAMLENPNWLKRTLVGLEHEFLGQVRLKLMDEERGVISISLSPALKGKGKGAIIIKSCIHSFFLENEKLKCIIAQVEMENIASQKTFERSDFKKIEENGNILLYEYQRGRAKL